MTNDFCQEENWPIAMIDLRRSLCITFDILISYKLLLNFTGSYCILQLHLFHFHQYIRKEDTYSELVYRER